MTRSGTGFASKLNAAPSEAARLTLGLSELDGLYTDLIRAFLPENREFERERIILALPRKREIAYMFGLLNEGENEAALLLELVAETIADDPMAQTEHLLEEMSYYLRTSIDREWQLEHPASASAALAYLLATLDERLKRIRTLPERPAIAFDRDRRLLVALQAEMPNPSRGDRHRTETGPDL